MPTENRQRLFGNWTHNWMAIATVASAPNPRAVDPRPTHCCWAHGMCIRQCTWRMRQAPYIRLQVRAQSMVLNLKRIELHHLVANFWSHGVCGEYGIKGVIFANGFQEQATGH